MITAVDSSVLSDVFRPDPVFGPPSKKALRLCGAQGQLIACSIVFAEVASLFPTAESAADAMRRLGVQFTVMRVDAALAAGAAWRRYRQHGGRRERVIADFLIGAHALLEAERLLTRDHGFYRSYFSGLVVLDPSQA